MIRTAVLLVAALLLGAGCQTLGTRQETSGAADATVLEARKLVSSHRYTDALSTLEKALSREMDPAVTSEMLYLTALIHVSADNPQKDYARALAQFEEFVRLYPDNDRAEEAKSWKQAIRALLDTKKENERLHRNIEGLKELDVRQEKKRLGK